MTSVKTARIGVIGLGIMGAGIVEVFAASGYQVIGIAENDQAVNQGKQNLAKSLDRAVTRGKLTDSDAKSLTAQVEWGTNFNQLANCDFVIEAAPELLDLKLEIFAQLDSVVTSKCVLATNTSSLSVSRIAKSISRPENVIGFHFFNPAPVQQFMELITTDFTASEVVQFAHDLGLSLGKYVAQVSDKPGFIVNKLLLVYLNHAVRLLDAKVATKQDIDSAMRELAGYPMGPLELIDLIGIDTCVEILKTIYQHSGNELHQPAFGLTKLLADGNKGRKSGSGFYDYAQKLEIPVSQNAEVKQAVFNELETAYLGDALAMESSGYAARVDIDNGMKLGCGLPVGPFERIEQIGLNNLREKQAALAQATGNSNYAPLPL